MADVAVERADNLRLRHVDAVDLEERLASLVSDRISPRLVPEIEVLPWRRSQVLALAGTRARKRPGRMLVLRAPGARGRGALVG